MTQDLLWRVTYDAVIASWVLLLALMLVRRRVPASGERRRKSASLGAMALQGLGFTAAWSLRRPLHTPIFPAAMPVQVVMAVVATGLAAYGLWFVVASIRTLGKQWALAARVVDDHQLITAGPYRLVRHPIYSGMFMMMIATALAVSTWNGFAVAIVLYWAGTVWRVRLEEVLMSETFGGAYEEYRRKVPAFIPWKMPA